MGILTGLLSVDLKMDWEGGGGGGWDEEEDEKEGRFDGISVWYWREKLLWGTQKEEVNKQKAVNDR